MTDTQKHDDAEFDWIQLSKDIQPDDDGFMKKTAKKFKENPAVPIGAFGAVGALSYGLYSMVNGNKLHSQYSMRARIGFQGFAIAALIFGFLTAAEPPSIKRQKVLDEANRNK